VDRRGGRFLRLAQRHRHGLDAPSSNFGWILIGDEAAGQTARRFDSRDNANPPDWPSLVVTYNAGPVPPTELDGDGDGYVECVPWLDTQGDDPAVLGGDDCDDAQPASFPGNPEICDGLDNDCNGVGDDGFIDTDLDKIADCVDPDDDNDGIPDGADCLPLDDQVWQLPGEVVALQLSHVGGSSGTTTLNWSLPVSLGGTAVAYDTISATQPDAFDLGTCVETDDGSDLAATDTTVLGAGQVLYFVVRGGNGCGEGSSGTDSALDPRDVIVCP
jgi:hypothetical protein